MQHGLARGIAAPFPTRPGALRSRSLSRCRFPVCVVDRALYVEPTPGGWSRPAAAISVPSAHDYLQDAVNDYAGRYQQGYVTSADSILKHIDPELYGALEQ
jgi:hypothetical protein